MAIYLSGDPAIVPETGELDLDLEARLMGPRIDVGADEVTPPGCVYAVTPSGAAFLRQGGPAPSPWKRRPGAGERP